LGYDVYITRKINWFDQNGPEISLADWTALVNSDPELRLDGIAQTQTAAGDMLKYENPGLAMWTSSADSNLTTWFDFRRGRIVVKNPGEQALRKMWMVAQVLSAKVQGDEGEVYGPEGKAVS
jgi:hypothetical protein